MDLNLYLGLPPLPRPPGRLGASMDCPEPAASPVPESPTPDDEPAAGSPAPEEMPPLPVLYSPSNAVFTPEMPLIIDPVLVDWLDGLSTDGEDTLDAGERAEASDSPSHDGLSTDSEATRVAGSPHDPDVLPPGLVIPVPEGPTTDEPAELLAQAEMLDELSDVDSPTSWGASWPIDIFTLFGHSESLSTGSEEALDAGEPAVAFDAPSHDANTSAPPPLPLAGLEGVRLEWVERLSHPDRSAGTEMVSTRESIEGAIEDTTPELRFQRLIQVSEQHHIVRPEQGNRNQRATSPEAERLAMAIQRSHNSLDASRRQKLDGDGNIVGTGAVNKDGNCGCNASFECNICLDAAKEPVVTPCGHLFCWPCLYQWLHAHSTHSECPVCKGEVLEVNVTPIYGRGGGERDASTSIDVPPRPSANRSESMREQLQMPDPRGIANMVRRLIQSQDHLRGQAAPPAGGVEVAAAAPPEGGPTVARIVGRRPVLASPSPLSTTPPRRRRARRFDYVSDGPVVQLPSSNSNNAAPAAAPQQSSSSVGEASTSSTMAVIMGQAAQSRRSRPPPEPTNTRRTRRRQQQ